MSGNDSKGDAVAATIRVAALTSVADASPGGLGSDMAAERDRVASYLDAGTAILATAATTADRYAPGLGEPVPLSVRSDGVWVWSDAITYYLRRYGLPVQPELYEHIRDRGYRCPVLDAAAAADALTAFAAARRG